MLTTPPCGAAEIGVALAWGLGKAARREVLDGVVAVVGYHRKSAVRLLLGCP